MTASTIARRNAVREPGVLEYPLGTAKKVIEGCAVAIDKTTGYAENFTAAANKKFVGFAMETVDNTDGSAGAVKVRVRTDAVVEVVTTDTLTNSAVGRILNLMDNQTGCLSASYLVTSVKWYSPVGRITEVISANRAAVSIGYGVNANAPSTTALS